eukprot:g3444.t1
MSMAAKKAKTLPKIIFGADHGGFGMKRELLKYVAGQGYETLDLGTNACGADGKAKRCDYPDIASSLGQAVLKHSGSLGVLVCGTGIGMSIAANKINGIRCALCHDHYTASMCRKHNNANVLALGERVIGIEVAKDIMDTYLKTDFEGGRHKTRVDKMMALESKI